MGCLEGSLSIEVGDVLGQQALGVAAAVAAGLRGRILLIGLRLEIESEPLEALAQRADLRTDLTGPFLDEALEQRLSGTRPNIVH